MPTTAASRIFSVIYGTCDCPAGLPIRSTFVISVMFISFATRRRTLPLLLILGIGLLKGGSLTAQERDSVLLENLGPNINSAYDEVGPVISPDGKTLYFDRPNHPENFGDDDIWYSELQRDGSWAPSRNIGSPLNNADNNFVSSVTPDGNTLLLGNVYNRDGSMGPGVSIVRRTRNGWGTPQALKIKNYYSTSSTANYRLANDGKTLLMAIQRNDSYGEMDIYVSFLQPNNEWSAPLNLGPDINSSGFDRTPFLAADGVTLYFSSDGLGGFGSSDIFVSRRLDSTWQKWSKPQNLGRPINTDGWDGFFTVPASGDYAYLVSARNSIGSADIFRVKLNTALRPNAVALISGRVLDAKTRKPIAAGITYKMRRGNQGAGSATSTPGSGEYKVTLPLGDSYSFRAEAEGYTAASRTVDLSKESAYKELTVDFLLTPSARGSVTRLNSVLFETGSAELRDAAIPELDRLVERLRSNPSMNVEIAGHTDNVGLADNNDDLSQRRAQAVVEYLTRAGIDAARLSARGYGESQPVASNGSDRGRQRNRRVEFRVLSN